MSRDSMDHDIRGRSSFDTRTRNFGAIGDALQAWLCTRAGRGALTCCISGVPVLVRLAPHAQLCPHTQRQTEKKVHASKPHAAGSASLQMFVRAFSIRFSAWYSIWGPPESVKLQYFAMSLCEHWVPGATS